MTTWKLSFLDFFSNLLDNLFTAEGAEDAEKEKPCNLYSNDGRIVFSRKQGLASQKILYGVSKLALRGGASVTLGRNLTV